MKVSFSIFLLLVLITNLSCKNPNSGNNFNLIADSISSEYTQNLNTSQLEYFSHPEYFMPVENQKIYKILYGEIRNNLTFLKSNSIQVDSIINRAKKLDLTLNLAFDTFKINKRSLRLNEPNRWRELVARANYNRTMHELQARASKCQQITKAFSSQTTYGNHNFKQKLLSLYLF